MDKFPLNEPSNLRNNPFTGQTSLPPKIPNPSASQPPVHCTSNLNDEQVHIPRSCSARILAEEQPPWLEELLNEPETPVNRGHRRSSSEPFTYVNANSREKEEYWLRNITEGPSWGFQRSSYLKDLLQTPSNRERSSSHETRYSHWKPFSNSVIFQGSLTSPEKDTIVTSGLSPSPQETAIVVQSQGDSASHNAESSSGGSDGSRPKPSAPPSKSKMESKRAKQHNGRRSRVKKLQYIAELEENVQALQAGGYEISAELEFLGQQNLILGMENRTLKQRLEGLLQVQLIKSMEQEILEREILRLQYSYRKPNLHTQHQQQQLQQQHPIHHRARSCDLNSQLLNLHFKSKEPNTSSDGFTVSLNR